MDAGAVPALLAMVMGTNPAFAAFSSAYQARTDAKAAADEKVVNQLAGGGGDGPGADNAAAAAGESANWSGSVVFARRLR